MVPEAKAAEQIVELREELTGLVREATLQTKMSQVRAIHEKRAVESSERASFKDLLQNKLQNRRLDENPRTLNPLFVKHSSQERKLVKEARKVIIAKAVVGEEPNPYGSAKVPEGDSPGRNTHFASFVSELPENSAQRLSRNNNLS